MFQNVGGFRGGRGDQIMMFAEPRGGAVVEYDAVLAQHQAIARAADRQFGERVDVQAIEEGSGIRALHVDLAERGDIAQADGLTHRTGFTQDWTPAGLPALGVIERTQPCAGFQENGTSAGVPVVQRRAADRLEVLAGLAAGETGEADRRHIGTERRHSDAIDRLGARFCQDRHANQTAGLALVGGHAVRGVALGVLGVLVAFAMGEADIGGGHIVLQVDEALAAAFDFPERFDRARHGLCD